MGRKVGPTADPSSDLGVKQIILRVKIQASASKTVGGLADGVGASNTSRVGDLTVRATAFAQFELN